MGRSEGSPDEKNEQKEVRTGEKRILIAKGRILRHICNCDCIPLLSK